jgi:arylsulfatase A-like enzyme
MRIFDGGRRGWAAATAVLAVVVFHGILPGADGASGPRRPNVLLVITDDQGHGDLGFHGNPRIHTPNLDALARRSARLERFHVSPVCAPTRASLLTGRYNYRTGVVDTYLGRALMAADETTLAEMLAAAGYATGIFGKWHLGDNYPLRPMDQGFQESLVLKGGGLGQPSDLPGGERYFDPVLLRNGRPTRTRGYVSDVITEAAARFIEANRERPFFAYLAFNAPHAPLEVPEYYRALYRDLESDPLARVYGMVTNIDDNVGRLLSRLDELRLAEDTIVVFLTDNGPQTERYNGGLRGVKGTVYEGGIRVPCFIRWPAVIRESISIENIAAHIDLAPTILEACGVERPSGVRLDGVSLLPLLRRDKVQWAARTLYFQWHRGDRPELYRAFAAVSDRWKLLQPLGVEPGKLPDPLKFELYDLAADPSEKDDLAGRFPERVEEMRRGYEGWFKDVSAGRGFDPPRIALGASAENPVVLTRQDWRGPRAGWNPGDLGHWEVQVAAAGDYEFTLRFAATGAGAARLSLGQAVIERPIAEGQTSCTLGPARLEAGPGRLEASISSGGEPHGVLFAEVKRLGEPLTDLAEEKSSSGAPPKHTNIIIILADDLGWGDLGCFGHPKFKTPHIDRLAAEGARLTSFYAPIPYCAPSRASLLTGRYPFRCGMTLNPIPKEDPVTRDADDVGLPPGEVTLADLLGKAGYRTALFGKWHLGHQPRFRPLRRGFDEYLGILYSNDMHPVELIDGDRRVEYPVVQATLASRLAERAVSFLEQNRERPFFLCFWPHAPHKPLAASEEFYGKSGAGLYGDAISELDSGVGRILTRLKELDLESSTLVVFTSDNGPWYGGSTGGLRGMKGRTWEGGLRVPLIARWPGKIPPGHVSDEPAGLMDLFATALSAAGLPLPQDRVIDGKDILPLLSSNAPSPHEAIFGFHEEKVATVRSGRWKLHLLPPGPAREKAWKPDEPWIDPRRPDGVRILAPYEQPHPSQFPGVIGGDEPVEGREALFDLQGDPAEQKDLAGAHPEVVERLKALAEKLKRG